MKRLLLITLFSAFLIGCFAACGEDVESLLNGAEDIKEFSTSDTNEILNSSDSEEADDLDNSDDDYTSDDYDQDNSSVDGVMKIDSNAERAAKIEKLAKKGLLIVWKMSASGEYDDEVTISVGVQGKKYYYSLKNDEEIIYDFTDSKKCVMYSRYGEAEKWNKEELSDYSEKDFKEDFYAIFDSVCSDAMLYASSMKETGKAKIAGRECAEYKISEEYMGSKIACIAYVDVETNIVLNTSLEVSVFGVSEKAESTCTVFDTNYQIKIPTDAEIENNEW